MEYKELQNKFSFEKVNQLCTEATNRLNILNLKDNLDNQEDATHLLNIALEDMKFTFRKISEHEIVIADKFIIDLEKTRKELESNFDKKDAKFISLFEELKRLFKKKNIEELTSDEMKDAISELKKIYEQANALNNKDLQLSTKYENDAKFAKIHKRIRESKIAHFKSESIINEILLEIKHKTDVKVLDNQDMIKNRDYFSEVTTRTILETLEENGIKDLDTVHFINDILINEYLQEMVA